MMNTFIKKYVLPFVFLTESLAMPVAGIVSPGDGAKTVKVGASQTSEISSDISYFDEKQDDKKKADHINNMFTVFEEIDNNKRSSEFNFRNNAWYSGNDSIATSMTELNYFLKMFDNKTKIDNLKNTPVNISKNNYKSVTLDDLTILHEFDGIALMNNQVKLLKRIDDHEYSSTGGDLVLNKKINSKGMMVSHDNDWYASMFMVGSGNGYFEEEAKRDTSTTFANLGEELNLSVEDNRKMSLLNSGAVSDNLKTYLFQNGHVADHVYTGQNKDVRVMDHKLIEPLMVFEYDAENQKTRQLVYKENFDNHLVALRNKSLWLPVKGLLREIGYNVDKIRTTLDELQGKDSEIARLDSLLKVMYRENEDVFGWSEQWRTRYNLEFDAHQKTKTDMSNNIKKYKLILTYGKSFNAEDWNENFNGKDEWSLYSSMPFVFGNSLVIGGGFNQPDMYHSNPVSTSNLISQIDENHPNRTVNTLKEEIVKDDLSQTKIFGYVGLETLNNLIVGIRLEKTLRSGLTTTSTKSTTWIGIGNDRIGENTIGPVDHKVKFDDNQWGLGPQIIGQIGPVVGTAYASWNLNTGKPSYGAGIGLDLADMYRTIFPDNGGK